MILTVALAMRRREVVYLQSSLSDVALAGVDHSIII